jgi:hypothetical protein
MLMDTWSIYLNYDLCVLQIHVDGQLVKKKIVMITIIIGTTVIVYNLIDPQNYRKFGAYTL